eukprot:CAMPEP_0168860728 /NCGR_PEP_ID=MMETSP0727-20121128/17539_1 /TAXON_ID=265536 /ORGANISM="Amphiprora sp., Strain CCMP467" /LENGTH=41 /DNA_ID= /DNA_START= /DNA_END= /DNA_ORIENTATION=
MATTEKRECRELSKLGQVGNIWAWLAPGLVLKLVCRWVWHL